jgi:hypothetical protein
VGRAAKVPPAEVTHTGRGGGRGYSLEYAAADHEGVGQAGWVEKREGRSLPGASLAAETKPVIGTTPPRSRLGISTLRFRAANERRRGFWKVSRTPDVAPLRRGLRAQGKFTSAGRVEKSLRAPDVVPGNFGGLGKLT